ncbi:methylated-DNA--[protein]-cysteine S-methyltransferase [Ignavibacterium sp.]|uniref:methylated-DNA--[protein]-cysteine S-methyltransferase n=1 Tax=Ignavibacterium sp. TaxID=2651167 RepID=UPI00307ED4F6
MQKLYFSEKKLAGISITALSDGEALKRILLNSALPFDLQANISRQSDSVLIETHKQLKEYFFEGRKVFSLPLNPDGSAFQKSVWAELLNIPYGRTISYKQLAEKMGDKNLIRAVGRANASNPMPIIIPCHRVIGSNGSLVGYSGGMKIKRYLLELEGVLQKDFFNS